MCDVYIIDLVENLSFSYSLEFILDTFNSFLAGFTVHVALPKRPIFGLNLFYKAGNRHHELTVLIYLHGHDHRYFALALHDDAFKVAKSLFVIITLQLIFKANYFLMVSRQAAFKAT
jgi:hypothetical protein